MKITFEQMKVNNERAIREFDQGIEHYPMAERLLQQNAREYPSYITYNNLAWYHHLGGEKDPLVYCRKALQLKRNLLSLRVLRRLLDNEHLKPDNSPRKLGKLIAIQQEVLSLSGDPVDGYVMGALLFRAKRYHEALRYLEKACNEVQTADVKRMQVTLSLCLSHLGRLEEAAAIAEKLYGVYMDRYLADEYFYTNELTPFHLIDMFYLSGNYERVVVLGDVLPEHGYGLDLYTLVKIFYSYKMIKPDEEYRMIKKDMTDKFYENERKGNPVCKRYFRMHKYLECKKYLSKIEKGIKPDFVFNPFEPYQCNFYGCPKHGTPYPPGS